MELVFRRIKTHLGLTISLLTLGVLLTYTYAFFFLKPYMGFLTRSPGMTVLEIYDESLQEKLQLNDVILRFGDTSVEELDRNKYKTYLQGVRPGEEISLQIQRDGETQTVFYAFPGINREEFLSRLSSTWFLSYIFWFAGVVTILFVRPKNTLASILTAFFFITSVGLISGNLSLSQILASAVVLRAAVWVNVPISLHLHWLFPTSLGKLPKWVLIHAYAIGCLLAAAEFLQIFGRSAYFIGFSISVICSILLLTLHFVRQPKERLIFGKLAMGFGIVLLPPLAFGLLGSFGSLPVFSTTMLLGIAALPGFYFYTIYRRQISSYEKRVSRLLWAYFFVILAATFFSIAGAFQANQEGFAAYFPYWRTAINIQLLLIAMTGFAPLLVLPALANIYNPISQDPKDGVQISANRMISFFLYTVCLVPLASVIYFFIRSWMDFLGENTSAAVLSAVIVAVITLLGFDTFQRVIERRLLGMPYNPKSLLYAYSERLATRLDRYDLSTLMTTKVLPSLLVRQSALVLTNKNYGLDVLFKYGLETDQLPSSKDLHLFQSQNGDRPQHLKWIRQNVPLMVNDEVIGYWLLGQRDPENTFTAEEINILQSLATQIAIALTNIQQTETLHALYTANIQEQENERSRLARDLHDNVLNKLAVMKFYLDEANPERMAGIADDIALSLRQTVDDLRPPMLDYGLDVALAELVDDTIERIDHRPLILIKLSSDSHRYPAQVEHHVYRMIQQAIDNALRHANANTIKLEGQLALDCIDITIRDDGVGFDASAETDLSDLLQKRHYGLVGMLERGSIANAWVTIESAPGQGTSINLRWEASEKDDVPPLPALSEDPLNITVNGQTLKPHDP